MQRDLGRDHEVENAKRRHFSEKLERLHVTFTALLNELAPTWPLEDLEFVREEIGHGVYDDALENLIAMGLGNGKGFSPRQVHSIHAMASEMEMLDSPWVVKLRQAE